MVFEDYRPSRHDGITPVTQPRTSRPTVVRKKFAKPPVKVACLSWYVSKSGINIVIHLPHGASQLTFDNSRASRTRCDGQDPCSNVRPSSLSSFIFSVDCRGLFCTPQYHHFIVLMLNLFPVSRQEEDMLLLAQ